MRTFVAVVDAGQFQDAAVGLGITQQGVSKRVAGLEKYLGVRLFARTARGAELTVEGRAFLPHARELVRVAERAEASVRSGGRALRVDVVARRIVMSGLLQEFHRRHPEVELEVLTLDADVEEAIAAVENGTVDVTFHAVPLGLRVPGAISTRRVIDEAHQLLVGPRHPFADARFITPAQLAGHRIWMPGLPTRGEVADYFDELSTTFGVTIDTRASMFAKEAVLEDIANSAELTMLIGEGTRYLWPDSYDLRRVPVRNPSLVYPMSMIWRTDNRHPALEELRAYLDTRRAAATGAEVWTPRWARDRSD
ncbi:LysR family transcriptional regulator [Nocardia terrae]|uniref:LysR substrate-binding domain-containing protein n=1 Tax=Nocardia terrae TaxID=2675851 RepID=UPI002E257AFC